MIQKRRRCLFFCPSWSQRPSHCPHHTGQTTPVSPRQYGLYIIRYIETYNADASLPSVCCDVKSLRSSWLTTTDVRKRLSHKIRPPALPTRSQQAMLQIQELFLKRQRKMVKIFSFNFRKLQKQVCKHMRHLFPDVELTLRYICAVHRKDSAFYIHSLYNAQ